MAYKFYCEKHLCYFCGLEEDPNKKGKGFRSLIETHHIIERNEGGSDHASNLVRVCSNCHSKCHLDLIKIKGYLDLGWCFKLEWEDEEGNKNIGPAY